MRIHYQNDIYPYYYEIRHTYDTPQNWAALGVESLVLWFCGREDNDAQQMYVELVDNNDLTGKITFVDTNAIRSESWHEWNIDLQSPCFPDVDMTAIKTIAIGIGDGSDPSPLSPTGDVYIDDITLYPPRCIAPLRKASDADITGERSLNFEDLRIMISDWLGGEYVTESLLWYQLDETNPYSVGDYDGSSADVDANSWQNLADKTLYFLGSNRCHAPGWLRLKRQRLPFSFEEANCRLCVKATKLFLEDSMENYEQGHTALNSNPQCILGLYLMEKFPKTKMANAAKQWFERSVESSCRLALGPQWKELLENQLVKVNKNLKGFEFTSFDGPELPFLLVYFAEKGSSENIRRQARERLAHYLLERYGLEPGLRQYQILLREGSTTIDEPIKLKVAKYSEQIGAICDAERLYEKILESTYSSKTAVIAAENLARIKLENSQQTYACQILDALQKRFPGAEITSEQLMSFCINFHAERKKHVEELVSELQSVQKENKALKLCRQLNRLLAGKEVLNKWHNLVDSTEPGSLLWQCGQLYTAQNLIETGNANAAKDILNNLSSSSYPGINARAILLLADIAKKNGKISDALALYQKAAWIERPTKISQWFKVLQTQLDPLEDLTFEELSCFASFWRGFNELLDNNIEMCTRDWLETKEIANKLGQKPLPLRSAQNIVAIIALAYLEQGDCVKPEQLVLQAMRLPCEDIQDGRQLSELFSRTQKVDDLLFALSNNLHYSPNQNTDKNQIEELTGQLYKLLSNPILFSAELDTTKRRLAQLFRQIRRQRVVKLLSAEYDWVKDRLTETENFEEFHNLEPIIFTVQLIEKDSFENISTALAAVTPQEYADGQMYRFARFAQQLKRPYMARMALNAAVQQIDNVSGNVELLKDIAEMYLEGNSHQKAIEIYDRIVQRVSDPNEAQKAQLKIIKIYAEQLKLYDKAIAHCQKYLTKFPDSAKISQVEFLVGKLAYLSGDYVGATGQLDSFERKYPDSPQTGEAMMLAALSRMSGGDTQDAVERFREIIQKFPDGDLAARSKFLIGYAQVSGQEYAQALETFKQLVEQFPESKYTSQARSFIDRLSKMSK